MGVMLKMQENRISKIKRNYLNEEAYKILKDAILTGKLKSGERIIELNLAKSMQISRTPLREALNKLKSEGMVYYDKNNKLIVSKTTMKELGDLFDLRIGLDGCSSRLACENITREEMKKLHNNIENTRLANKEREYKKIIKLNEEFHDIITAASRNNRLISMMNSIKEQIKRYRQIIMWSEKEAENSLNGHVEIYEALKNKDSENIMKISEHYILLAKEGVLKRISKKNISK